MALNDTFIAAGPYYRAFAPGPWNILYVPHHKWAMRGVMNALKARKYWKMRREGQPYANLVGSEISGRIMGRAMKPLRPRINRLYVRTSRTRHDWTRKNGVGGRTWIDAPGRYRMVMIYHEANKAGPHIDVHIGRMSIIYRVKPAEYEQLRYNNKGMLTENSRLLLLNFVRREISENRFAAQNIDHTRSGAVTEWVNGDTEGTNYGDGLTRQIILDSEVDIYKAFHRGPIEMYAPAINPHRPLYLFRAFHPSRNEKRTPTLVWGTKAHNPPSFEDRLHLKMIQPTEEDKFLAKVDPSTITLKYDGASCYFVINKHGTTVWSPRTSKRTGEAIEYTHKLNGIARVTTDRTSTVDAAIIGMGELMYRDSVTGSYISASEVGGLLNSQALVSSRYEPEIRIYRVDRVGRQKTIDLPFWENRKLQEQVAEMHPMLNVVQLTDIRSAHTAGFEGVVGVPEGKSVLDGFKVKWHEDADDWMIERVEFFDGDKGGVAGVVHCVSLTSGKTFKLGPSQVGNQVLTREMMAHPENYVGEVMKVNSRRGHEGRAAKVVDFHLDKDARNSHVPDAAMVAGDMEVDVDPKVLS